MPRPLFQAWSLVPLLRLAFSLPAPDVPSNFPPHAPLQSIVYPPGLPRPAPRILCPLRRILFSSLSAATRHLWEAISDRCSLIRRTSAPAIVHLLHSEPSPEMYWQVPETEVLPSSPTPFTLRTRCTSSTPPMPRPSQLPLWGSPRPWPPPSLTMD